MFACRLQAVWLLTHLALRSGSVGSGPDGSWEPADNPPPVPPATSSGEGSAAALAAPEAAQADADGWGSEGSSEAQDDTEGSAEGSGGSSATQADIDVSTVSGGGSSDGAARNVSPPAVSSSELVKNLKLKHWLPTGMTGAAASGRCGSLPKRGGEASLCTTAELCLQEELQLP